MASESLSFQCVEDVIKLIRKVFFCDLVTAYTLAKSESCHSESYIKTVLLATVTH